MIIGKRKKGERGGEISVITILSRYVFTVAELRQYIILKLK